MLGNSGVRDNKSAKPVSRIALRERGLFQRVQRRQYLNGFPFRPFLVVLRRKCQQPCAC